MTATNTAFKSVDEYISSQPQHARAVLNRVRRVIRQALPEAEETISYKMPAYQLNGETVLYFAGWQGHYSLYGAPVILLDRFKVALASYEIHKGTIRFPLCEPVPVKLIERIVKFRAKQSRQSKLSEGGSRGK